MRTRPKDLPLDPKVAGPIIDTLQTTLIDLKALSLVTKQLHWNIRGPHFKPIHEHLDLVYDSVEESADEVAERITQLGGSPNAQPADVAKSAVKPVENGFIIDHRVLELIVDRLATAIHDVRDRLEQVEDSDPVTADLLHAVLLPLEKHLWMLRSHLVPTNEK